MISPRLFKSIRNFWISLTDEELEKTKGNMLAIVTLIQSKYGHNREVITGILEDIYRKAGTTNNVGSELTNAYL